MSDRCIDGRLWRAKPLWDDPYYEYDVGECPDCEGKGCVECPTCHIIEPPHECFDCGFDDCPYPPFVPATAPPEDTKADASDSPPKSTSAPGASLRACGWKLIGERGGGSWSRSDRPRQDKAPTERKHLWELELQRA